MSRKARKPRFYFSFRSPYSWLAYRDLMDHHRWLATELDWRPFWEPDKRSEQMLAQAKRMFPYVDMSRPKHLYILADVDRLRRARGLEITWPTDRDPVWEVPHLAYLAAADEGRGPEFIDAVYAARWQRAKNICDPATIAQLAAELGLRPERLAGAADDVELRARGLAALLDVVDDGVFGVPFFVHGFDKFWGVDRLSGFVSAVSAARAPGATPSAPAGQLPHLGPGPADRAGAGTGQSADQGHAGGCG